MKYKSQKLYCSGMLSVYTHTHTHTHTHIYIYIYIHIYILLSTDRVFRCIISVAKNARCLKLNAVEQIVAIFFKSYLTAIQLSFTYVPFTSFKTLFLNTILTCLALLKIYKVHITD